MNEWVDWLANVKILQKAAVADDGGNVLLLKRSETKSGARQGKWDLPG